MRIAYLVLAHENPDHLGRLMAALDAPGHIFHVHIDAKADLTPFRTASAGQPVLFLPDDRRVAINWCGFSMVEATLRLLDAAARTGADRFVLLSGSDYPARPLREIHACLEQDREFIQVDRRLDPHGADNFDLCARRPFTGDSRPTNPRTGHRGIICATNFLARWLPDRTYRLPVYYGSSWWALTGEAVAHVLRIWREQPETIDAFRFARSPDEMVFQTLLKASPRSGHIAFDATDPGFDAGKDRAALHYVNWDRPNPNAPRTVDGEDYEPILSSDALFVRKIDPARSAALLDRLDLRIAV